MTKISVFGLGYVGTVTIACLADAGHQVIGVDVNPVKVNMINQGMSPVVEEGVGELIQKGRSNGRIRATIDVDQAVQDSTLSIICVGTPSQSNGSLDLTYVERVCEQIGASLATKDIYHVVVARSTMLPGSTEEVVIPILERTSGKKAGIDFGVAFNPEFLREGSSIKDFYDPPYTVVGADNEKPVQALRELYAMINSQFLVTPIKVAEMVKYVSNIYHALKVTFANEIGNICKQQNIDSHQVMDVFIKDTKLNISSAYLKPGFAFGGSCLPKDLRALIYHARQLDQEPLLLRSILESNRRQVDVAYQMIKSTQRKQVGVLGFSFKAGTDDLRESPIVELIEQLIGKGYSVRVYDRNVSLANLQGANKAYIEKEIPHIASLMCDEIDDLLRNSEVVVIGNKSEEFRKVLNQLHDDQTVIDLVRLWEDTRSLNGQYQGISW
jgi:GDP-mannose 6-dehydrogenase